MRIALINPPQDDAIRTELPGFIGAAAGVFPPLGLMYIAAFLKKHNLGCQVSIIDSVARRINIAATLKEIVELSPDVVGIMAYTQNLLSVSGLVKEIKKAMPDSHITLGGPHPTVFPDASVRMKGVDSIVEGEGETVFSDLAETLSRNGDLTGVRGIAFQENGRVRHTDAPMQLDDLDEYPFPERKGMDLGKYSYILGAQEGFMTTMVSGRGCNGKCSFCSTPRSCYRQRSVRNIVDEMEECRTFNIREIHFVDDTFNADLEHAKAVCHEIKRRGLNITWGIRARADNLSGELLQLLKESGCRRVNIGVETASDLGLNVLRKGITVEQIRNAFALARKAGLVTAAYFMLGCPHEKTVADVKQTIDFAIELDPDYAMFNLLTLYPGTPLYREAVEKGIVRNNHWEDFVENPRKDFLVPYWEEWLERDVLEGLLRDAYKRFYLRPKFILKALKNTSARSTFIRRTRAGMNILQGAR